MKILVAITSFVVLVSSAPQGEVGIDFLGFKVGAGLNGGPHAFAQTPYGPKAAAGVGGESGAYAGAEVDSSLGAAAGVGASGAVGVAQAPGVVKYKYKGVSPNVGVRSSVNVETAPAPVAAGGVATYQVTKTASPTFFNDIFNIPISTLKAVNQLVNGVQATKHVSVSSYPSTTYKEVNVQSQPSASAGFNYQVSKEVAPVSVSKPEVAVQASVEKVPETPATTDVEVVKTVAPAARFGFQWSKTYGVAPPVETAAPSTEKTVTVNNDGAVLSQPLAGFGFHYAKAFGPAYYRRPHLHKYRYRYVAPAPSVGFRYNIAKTTSPAFYDSVFNIPITALKAVNQLVNGAGVSASVTKQVSIN